MQQPSREAGLRIYNDPQYKQRLLEVYGETYVNQCLDMAVQVVPSRRMHKPPSMFTKGETKAGKNRAYGNGIRIRKPKRQKG